MGSGLARSLNSLTFARNQSTLVLVEHNNEKINPVTLNAITAAKALGGEVNCLVAGTSCGDVAKEVASVDGISKVLVAEDAAFAGFMPEKLTPLLLAPKISSNFPTLSLELRHFLEVCCPESQRSWMYPRYLISLVSKTVKPLSGPSMLVML